MFHTANNIKIPTDILQYFLKHILKFQDRYLVWWEYAHEDVPDSVGILWISCGKTVGCSI